jgi:predicted Zn-dependent peptidase
LEFHEARLDNGLTLIAEHSPGVYSVALGFFVRTGARDETECTAGVSHFLEHMVFKGSSRHTADDVNRIFDEVGAKYNASTSEELTLFYAAVLPEYLPRSLDLLADILRPALRPEDFEVEKKVILEEIGMYDDQPTFVTYERLMQTHFKGHALGHSVLGTNESITGLTCAQMRDYFGSRYTAANTVLAAAGRFDWPELLDLARTHCSGWPSGAAPRDTTEARPVPGGTSIVTRPGSLQQHMMLMVPAPPARNPLHYAADILAVIVGDDTGSRLFWELVDPGHAETADMGFNEYDGSGAWLCYFSCTPEDVQPNLERINAIFEDINNRGVSEVELEQARNKVASRIVLRSERPMGRLGSLGHNWLLRQEYRPVEADLQTLREISAADIRRLVSEYPLKRYTISTVGPLESL